MCYKTRLLNSMMYLHVRDCHLLIENLVLLMLQPGCCNDDISIVKTTNRTEGNWWYFMFFSFLHWRGIVEESSLYFVN